jgi:hypothetical protein
MPLLNRDDTTRLTACRDTDTEAVLVKRLLQRMPKSGPIVAPRCRHSCVRLKRRGRAESSRHFGTEPSATPIGGRWMMYRLGRDRRPAFPAPRFRLGPIPMFLLYQRSTHYYKAVSFILCAMHLLCLVKLMYFLRREVSRVLGLPRPAHVTAT